MKLPNYYGGALCGLFLGSTTWSYIYISVCVYNSSLNDVVLLGKFSPKSCYPGASRPGLSAEVGKELDTAMELWSERCGAMELPLRHAKTRVVVFHPNSSH